MQQYYISNFKQALIVKKIIIAENLSPLISTQLIQFSEKFNKTLYVIKIFFKLFFNQRIKQKLMNI